MWEGAHRAVVDAIFRCVRLASTVCVIDRMQLKASTFGIDDIAGDKFSVARYY
jgi:hypothetical protein